MKPNSWPTLLKSLVLVFLLISEQSCTTSHQPLKPEARVNRTNPEQLEEVDVYSVGPTVKGLLTKPLETKWANLASEVAFEERDGIYSLNSAPFGRSAEEIRNSSLSLTLAKKIEPEVRKYELLKYLNIGGSANIPSALRNQLSTSEYRDIKIKVVEAAFLLALSEAHYFERDLRSLTPEDHEVLENHVEEQFFRTLRMLIADSSAGVRDCTNFRQPTCREVKKLWQ